MLYREAIVWSAIEVATCSGSEVREDSLEEVDIALCIGIGNSIFPTPLEEIVSHLAVPGRIDGIHESCSFRSVLGGPEK